MGFAGTACFSLETGRDVVRLARHYTVRFGIVRFFSVGLIIAAAAVLAADSLTVHAAGAVRMGFLLGGVIVLGITQDTQRV